MAEPDWTDVVAARHWLELRYPLASSEKDSPFYQYLRDEQAKGNRPKGREKHLSRGIGGELLKWMDEHAENSLFNYPIENARFIYYPEFIDEEQFSRSGSRTPDEVVKLKVQNAMTILNTPQERRVLSKQFGNRNNPKSQKAESLNEGQTLKSLDSTTATTATAKRPRGRDVPIVDKRKATREIANSLSRQIERISTLRPRRNCKRPRTGILQDLSEQLGLTVFDLEFFYPY